MFDCILEQCIFYTGIVKRSSAKQNGCSGTMVDGCRSSVEGGQIRFRIQGRQWWVRGTPASATRSSSTSACRSWGGRWSSRRRSSTRTREDWQTSSSSWNKMRKKMKRRKKKVPKTASSSFFSLGSARDQGIMHGYTGDEIKDAVIEVKVLGKGRSSSRTDSWLMENRHRHARRLWCTRPCVRNNGDLWWLRPDGKTQVTINYVQQADEFCQTQECSYRCHLHSCMPSP